MSIDVRQSYSLHAGVEKKEALNQAFPSIITAPESIDNIRHVRMIDLIAGKLAQIYHDSLWLTVGDGHFGSDAIRLKRYGVQVHASSLTDTSLAISNDNGWIDEFSASNAENLNFPDESFDFVMCKEAYHHFPRPPVAFYEMLRVAKCGVVLIEPNRQGTRPLGFVRDLFKRMTGRYVAHGYEESGNYIFTLSLPEIVEMARAVDLPTIGYRYCNDFYHPKLFRKAVADAKERRLFNIGVFVQDALSSLGLMSYGRVSIVVFKMEPDEQTKAKLRKEGVSILNLPRNPHFA